MPQIKQIFFDCDNTLALSEDLAFEASTELVNEILAEHGIDQRYTDLELIIDFIGQSFKGMMVSLQAKYGFTMTADRMKDYARREELALVLLFRNKVQPTRGSVEVVKQLHEKGRYGLAVVSSSGIDRIRVCLETAGHALYIPREHVFSAVSSLPQPAPKPNPAVYHHAMEVCGVQPEDCVAVEDSKSGALSAVRANIPCIAYVGAYGTRAAQEQVAETLREAGCCAVIYQWSEFAACLEEFEAS